MTVETLAEVLCNLAGDNPNDDETWDAALVEARQNLDDVNSGAEPWWEVEG